MAKRTGRKRRTKKIKTKIIWDTVPSPLGNGVDYVERNMDDPILYMYRRKNKSGQYGLSEQQFLTAMKYRQAYYIFSGQTNLAIDYEKPKVDTSGVTQSLHPVQIDAADTIREVNKGLDVEQRYILQMIVGEHWTLKEYALKRHGLVGSQHQRAIKRQLCEVLDVCGNWWGFTSSSKARPKTRVSHNTANEGVEGDWPIYISR